MKKQTLRKTLAIVMSVLMLVSVMPLSTMAAEETDCIVIMARDLFSNASLVTFTGETEFVDDEANSRQYFTTEVTANGTVNDGNAIQIDLSGANIIAKDYPVVQIRYKANIANPNYIDLNIGVNRFCVGGDTNNKQSTRIWGPKPVYETGTSEFTTFYLDAATQTTGTPYGDGGSYSWSYVADDAKYTYLLLKLWGGQKGTAPTVGDTFDIEYIAFFPDVDTMNSYEYSTELEDITVPEEMIVEQGTLNKLNVTLVPATAYCKELVYVSDDESVAKVTENGEIIALTPGEAWIDVSTPDGEFTNSCCVTVTEPETDYSGYVIDRDNLENLIYKINNDKKLNVVYLGGSVTDGAGASSSTTSWRALTGTWLQKMFPEAEINLQNSAMGGSGSMLGAFRTEVDVLDYDPDLVFVDCSVNDGANYSGHVTDGTEQFYYESIIRQIRENSPDTEIISIYVTEQANLNVNGMHSLAKSHDEVAAHYGITGIDVGRALTDHIKATGASWDEYVTDIVHPGDKGYEIYANVIKQYLFSKLFNVEVPTEIVEHTVPETYIDDRNIDFIPNYVEVSKDIFKDIKGWTYSSEKAFSRLDTAGYIYPSAEENSFTYIFKGTGIAFFMEFAGGKYHVEWSIDDGEPQSLKVTDTNHPFNKMFKTGALENKIHKLTFSYKGAEGTGGTNNSIKLTRFLVSQLDTGDADVLYGDIDGNGVVETVDSIVLSRHVANWVGYGADDINLESADVDGVDGVDASDALVLSRYFAKWTGYEFIPFDPAE